MKRIRTVIAFSVLGILLAAGLILPALEKNTDVYPSESTLIRLYGEAHGYRPYYDTELKLWQELYEKGNRNLFVELPYYSAEWINLWMKEDSDETLDLLFEEIKNTQSGCREYAGFFRGIKESCPDTVFYGTDVGHQYDTTGARYLRYLEERNLTGSDNYKLAKECIRQGEEYDAVRTETGISPVREAYMIANFIDAYGRCGGGTVMGIYGSYHTDLEAPELMAGKLRQHFGNIISSVRLSTLALERKPYSFGIGASGVLFLLMLFVPNLFWTKRKPSGYENIVKKENRTLVVLERTGEIGVTASLLIFRDYEPCIRLLPEGLHFDFRIILWVSAFALMILYECYWIRYFNSKRTLADFYSSFAGFPLAGAVLPVTAVLLLGIYSKNLILTAFALILGAGHIGIHFQHSRELKNDRDERPAYRQEPAGENTEKEI